MKTKTMLGLMVGALLLTGGLMYAKGDVLQGKFSVPTSSRVDLTISEIYVDEDYKLNIVQKNKGTTNATGNGHTYVYINGALEWTYSWSTLSDQSFLKAGKTSILQPQTIEEGSTVEACIDPKKVVSESNESNNCLEVEVGPDVNLSYLYTSPSPALVGESLQIAFNIQNQSSGPAPEGEVTLAYEINGVAYPEETFEIDAISSPGASDNNIILEIDSLPAAGSYSTAHGTYTHALTWTKIEFSYDQLSILPVGRESLWFNAE